jgi:hypothetical protein
MEKNIILSILTVTPMRAGLEFPITIARGISMLSIPTVKK